MEKFNHINKDLLSSVKEDHYKNKYGESLNMIETQDGNVYFKHEDFYNGYVLLDDLINVLEWSKWNPKSEDEIKLKIVLSLDEKNFMCNFLKGTKYEYLIPHISNKTPIR